jgi:hypothetical protein
MADAKERTPRKQTLASTRDCQWLDRAKARLGSAAGRETGSAGRLVEGEPGYTGKVAERLKKATTIRLYMEWHTGPDLPQ